MLSLSFILPFLRPGTTRACMVDCAPVSTLQQALIRLNIISRDEHCISRKNISDGALKVMARLRSGGYQAYLVGGAVR